MLLRNRTESTERRRGAAVIEFSIVAIPLFVFLLACFEFARLVNCYQILEGETRQAVRDMTVNRALNVGTAFKSDADIETAAENRLISAGIKASAIRDVTITRNSFHGKDYISIEVELDWNQLTWVPTNTITWVSQALVMTHTATTTQEDRI